MKPTYSTLSRAMGVPPQLHPAQIDPLWDYAQGAKNCIVEIGTGQGDTTLLMLLATRAPTRVYSLWDDTPTPEQATFEAVQQGIISLGLASAILSRRFAYLMGDSVGIAQQWERTVDLLLLKSLTYERIKINGKAWLPHVTLGGHIIIPGNRPPSAGIERYIKELEARQGFDLIEQSSLLSIFQVV